MSDKDVSHDLTTASTTDLVLELKSRCRAFVFGATGLPDWPDGNTCHLYHGPIVEQMGLARGITLDVESTWEAIGKSDGEDVDV